MKGLTHRCQCKWMPLYPRYGRAQKEDVLTGQHLKALFLHLELDDIRWMLDNLRQGGVSNTQFLYSAFHTRKVSPSPFNMITPGHWALNHSLNHLSSLGSIQPVLHFSAKPIARTTSTLAGTYLAYPWVNRSNYS